MTEFQKLNLELRDHGVPAYQFFQEEGLPIDTLVNRKISSKPYIEILLRYFPIVQENEKEMIVRALSEKGLNKAVPLLIEIFKNSMEYSELFLWTVSNALSIIDDKESYPEVIQLCKNTELGISRQLLFSKMLPKMKDKKAYEVLLTGLADKNVRGHALEGLGKLGDSSAITEIEKTKVEKGKYEYKAKEKAMKKLKTEKRS